MSELPLFDQLCNALRERPTIDRSGEAHITCPNCLHEGNSKKTNFSFSERGGKCFRCQYGAGLGALAKKFRELGWLAVGVESRGDWSPAVRHEKKRADACWYQRPEDHLERYLGHPERLQLWQAYKNLTIDTIAKQRLGVGVLPPVYIEKTSGEKFYPGRCDHRRLIYPVFQVADGKLTEKILGFRGRAMSCDCSKWLSSGGLRAALWGLHLVTPGCRVVAVENPVDAWLAMQNWPSKGDVFVGPTAGAATWLPEWTQEIVERGASEFLCAYDNDLAGCPNPETYRSELALWQEKMEAMRAANPELAKSRMPAPPSPNGVRLVRQFEKTPVKAYTIRWPNGTPPRADVGWWIANK